MCSPPNSFALFHVRCCQTVYLRRHTDISHSLFHVGKLLYKGVRPTYLTVHHTMCANTNSKVYRAVNTCRLTADLPTRHSRQMRPWTPDYIVHLVVYIILCTQLMVRMLFGEKSFDDLNGQRLSGEHESIKLF